jgi:SAM-dependent methyltransferase
VERRSRSFWDARAEEDAFFFVDNRLDYRKPDLDRFWRGGEEDLDKLLAALGVAVRSDDSVVEIGCGVGRLTRVLAARAADVRALDVSQRMLDVAQEHNGGLANVTWLLGDGASLTGVDAASADACVSHVVFQHVPDPEITLSYVREMGRVLRPGGWAAFQISNDPAIHRPRRGVARLRDAVKALVGRAPRGQANPAWRGSAVELGALRAAAADGGMEVERVEGEGTQYCLVLARRARPTAAGDPA